jgi:hypothetical protein
MKLILDKEGLNIYYTCTLISRGSDNDGFFG